MLRSSFSCYPHVIENLYCSIGVNLTGGLLVRWFRDHFGAGYVKKAQAGRRDPYELMFADMSDEPRDIFVLPHFVGAGTPWFDRRSRGPSSGSPWMWGNVSCSARLSTVSTTR
jgi:xylulokinase